jgi:hypothetical protein
MRIDAEYIDYSFSEKNTLIDQRVAVRRQLWKY